MDGSTAEADREGGRLSLEERLLQICEMAAMVHVGDDRTPRLLTDEECSMDKYQMNHSVSYFGFRTPADRDAVLRSEISWLMSVDDKARLAKALSEARSTGWRDSATALAVATGVELTDAGSSSSPGRRKSGRSRSNRGGRSRGNGAAVNGGSTDGAAAPAAAPAADAASGSSAAAAAAAAAPAPAPAPAPGAVASPAGKSIVVVRQAATAVEGGAAGAVGVAAPSANGRADASRGRRGGAAGGRARGAGAGAGGAGAGGSGRGGNSNGGGGRKSGAAGGLSSTPCRYFNSSGGCRRSDECPYAHVPGGESSGRGRGGRQRGPRRDGDSGDAGAAHGDGAAAPDAGADAGGVRGGAGKGGDRRPRGRAGGRGRGLPEKSSTPCKYVNTPSGCGFGKNCRFSHAS